MLQIYMVKPTREKNQFYIISLASLFLQLTLSD